MDDSVLVSRKALEGVLSALPACEYCDAPATMPDEPGELYLGVCDEHEPEFRERLSSQGRPLANPIEHASYAEHVRALRAAMGGAR